MFISSHRSLRRALGAALFFSVVLAAGAAPTTTTTPLAPYGDGGSRSAGAPAPLSPGAFMLSATGADGQMMTADDMTLIVQDHAGPLSITALPTPSLSRRSGQRCVLSATSCLVHASGADEDWETADDVVYLFTHLGSDNVITTIPVGFLYGSGTCSPYALSSTSAAIVSCGTDGDYGTADDELVILTDLGGANTVTRVPAPYLHEDFLSRPIVLSSSSLLLGSMGPDVTKKTADDTVYLFTAVGGANTRTDLPTPVLTDRSSGRPTRVSATRAVVSGAGADASRGTPDDLVYLLDDLGGANVVTPISAGAIFDYSAGRCVAMREDAVVFCSPGPDGNEGSADDTVVVISGLGGANLVQPVTVGSMDEDRQCQPVRLTPYAFAVVTFGPDESAETPDDTLAIVTEVGGTNTVTHVTVPGLGEGSTSTPVALSATSLMVRNGGPDGDIGEGGDDVVTLITSATTTPQVMTFPTGEDGNGTYESGLVPVPLGAGRAVYLLGGANNNVGTGGDDEVAIVDGLDRNRDFTLNKLWIKFKPTAPQKGEKYQVAGVVALDTVDLFACDDVTISIGNAAQTIPAGAFTRTRSGWFKYKDRKRVNGFIQAFTYKPKNGKVTISGKGLGTGGETTDPAYVPVVIACAELFLGDAVVGDLKKPGIKYKAPK